MPKVGICNHLPFPLILGFDWQQQVQARCTYNSNGALCISTPSSLRLYECIHASKPSINCIASNEVSLPPLEDVVLSDLNTKMLPSQAQLIPKFAKLSTIQQAQLDAVIGKFSDMFYSDNDNIGLCPYIEFKIDLHDKPIRCRPYRFSEPDCQLLNMQIQKWLKQGICRPSNSTYAASAFIVEQPFHESTQTRVVIDYSRTINSITKLDPHPIGHMEDVIKHNVGKCYISKMDVKSAFNTIHIKETDIFKTGFVTPDGHYEFLRMLFGLERKTSNATIILTDDQQRTFETLKTAITTASILVYFKQGLPTFLETDASYSGLGAVLSQDRNEKCCIIEYASRTLKDAETRYHINELECTAVHWALTEKFLLYLLGHKFQLITDNYTTAYVVAKSAVSRKFARYLVDLAQFDFTTLYRPGKQNVIADHLSWFPTPPVCLTVTASHQSEICTKQKQDDFCQYMFRLLKE
ncbi:retrovirus-related Pol polyprotein from transposon 297 [Trichonephila clavipes]|uniref:Retrovirus-related Pol polyprotein from transposon 297 n=1 Tax=Trichonephila clavipes TaxID=2585209 RepID=A0A8X7BKX3_TRICX|nr:retrovirus-related Pol polyprotein from transposon 297 [Trichonephila clavipes]